MTELEKLFRETLHELFQLGDVNGKKDVIDKHNEFMDELREAERIKTEVIRKMGEKLYEFIYDRYRYTSANKLAHMMKYELDNPG